jgi:hypothetical protein
MLHGFAARWISTFATNPPQIFMHRIGFAAALNLVAAYSEHQTEQVTGSGGNVYNLQSFNIKAAILRTITVL